MRLCRKNRDEASRLASFLFVTSVITAREHMEHEVTHFPSSHDHRCELATCFGRIYGLGTPFRRPIENVIVKNIAVHNKMRNGTVSQEGKQPNPAGIGRNWLRGNSKACRGTQNCMPSWFAGLYITYDILSNRILKLNQNFNAVDFWSHSPTFRFLRFTKPQTGERTTTATTTATTTTNIPQIPFLVHDVHQRPK